MYRLCYILIKKYIVKIIACLIQNIAAFTFSLPIVILLAILHFLHFAFKWSVLLICSHTKNSVLYGTGWKFAKGLDYGWLEDRWQGPILQAVLVFDSKINVSRIRELITHRVIPLYPRLAFKICPLPWTAESVHHWIPDDTFDINRHVFNEPVTIEDNECLQVYLSKLTSTKLPNNQSPWELRVLSQSIDCSSTDTIIILRIHQSLADGMTLIKILCTKLSDTRASFTAYKNHYRFSYYLKLIHAFCIGPALLLCKLATLFRTEHMDKDSENCTLSWSTNISLCKVDRIKQVTRSSYNCVLLSAFTGALRYVLQSSGIKHPPDLKITLPFVTGKNHNFIPVLTKIPTSMEGAIPRLWQTKYQLKAMSNSYDLLLTSFLCHILFPICPRSFIHCFNRILNKPENVQFSSIVGPTSRLVIDGSPLKTIYPLLSCENDLGLSTAVTTYADQVYITIMSHSALGNTGKLLLNFIEDQVDRMYSLLINRTIPEDLGDNYFQNQLPDISELPVKELKSRMQMIQHELQRLSEMISYSEEDVKKFAHFKSEFNHIFKELRRRKSIDIKLRKRSIFNQFVDNISSTFSSRKSISTILYPYVEDFNADGTSQTTEEVKVKPKSNFAIDESMQLLFYKKFSPRNSFRVKDMRNANKYIYLTLLNEKSTLDKVASAISDSVYETRDNRLYYKFSSDEQII